MPPSELPGSTIRADLLARTREGVVHVEFVKDATRDLDLRMVDYRLRLRRRDRDVVGAAITLASIVLPGSAISTALREADMPVPVRDTPLGRELIEQGRQEGRQEAEQMAAAWLRQRFGDDDRIPSLAARLAELPNDERISRISSARRLGDLAEH